MGHGFLFLPTGRSGRGSKFRILYWCGIGLTIYRGQQESPSKITLPAYDPSCYLCPGNKRAAGDTNPAYPETFVFVNDYSAVKEDQPDYEQPPAESTDGTSPLLLMPFYANTRRQIPSPPPCSSDKRQMLRNLFQPIPQPNPRRPPRPINPPYNPHLDSSLCIPPTPHLTPLLPPTNSPRNHRPARPVHIHADLRKQRLSHGLLKPPPSRPSLDNHGDPRGALTRDPEHERIQTHPRHRTP